MNMFSLIIGEQYLGGGKATTARNIPPSSSIYGYPIQKFLLPWLFSALSLKMDHFFYYLQSMQSEAVRFVLHPERCIVVVTLILSFKFSPIVLGRLLKYFNWMPQVRELNKL